MPQNETIATQDFVDIDHIKDDVVILRSGSLRKILLASGVNIELKSEDEQSTIYLEYQNFLNGLDFSLQLLVHSRKLNINKYLGFLEQREVEEGDDLLKNQLSEYREFIGSFVAENDIMTKNFFVVVPYDSPILPSKKQVTKALPSFLLFKNRSRADADTDSPETEEFQKDLLQLNQRVEHVISGLHTMGLRAITLSHDELLELFYNLYNPESTEKKDINLRENG